MRAAVVWAAVARGLALPLGALHGVDWEARELPSSSGAPHAFSLFYPALPSLPSSPPLRPSSTSSTSSPPPPPGPSSTRPPPPTTNPPFSTPTATRGTTRRRPTEASARPESQEEMMPQLPFLPELPRSSAAATSPPPTPRPHRSRSPVPVIHLSPSVRPGDDTSYDFFPQELLEDRPYRIKIIETEDFIDYEIEFLDIGQDGEEDEEEGGEDDGDYDYEYYQDAGGPGEASGFGLPFMALLERARQKHRSTTATAAATTAMPDRRVGLPRGVAGYGGRSSTTTSTTTTSTTSKTRWSPRTTGGLARQPTTEMPAMETTTRHGETTEPAQETTTQQNTMEEATLPAETTTAPEATTESREEEPTRLPPMPTPTPMPGSSLPAMSFSPLPFIPELPRSSVTFSEEVELTTELRRDEPTTTSTPIQTSTTAMADTTVPEEIVTVVSWTAEGGGWTESGVLEVETEEVVTEDGGWTEGGATEVETELPARGQDTGHPERRPKKIQSDGVKDQQVASESEVILSGQYHEVNPGQYSGQYHELGQYHEQNPGQYHEVNPGQYNEVSPGQVDVENVKVDFQQHRTEDTRTYNVQASAGAFILGEVGRIDSRGQTLQGVRYTAVEGEVDEARIMEILNRYFGTRMK